MNINAYVDGSYNADTNEYGFGVYVVPEDGPFSAYFGKGPCKEGGRQVEGEVQAARFAIAKFAGEENALHIFYDYEGVEKWATEKWRANKGYTKEYAEFAKDYGNVTFTHTKGHTGVFGNEVADGLAKTGACIAQTSASRKALKEAGIDVDRIGYPVSTGGIHIYEIVPEKIDEMVAQRLSNKENEDIER